MRLRVLLPPATGPLAESGLREALLSGQKAVTSGYAVTSDVPAPVRQPQDARPHAPTDAPAGSPLVSRVDHDLAYRAILGQAFTLIVAGPAADAQECRRVLDEETRLIDEVGVRRAAIIRREVARDWYRQNNMCPWCASPGVFHDLEVHP